jgi:hypothetical protein
MLAPTFFDLFRKPTRTANKLLIAQHFVCSAAKFPEASGIPEIILRTANLRLASEGHCSLSQLERRLSDEYCV